MGQLDDVGEADGWRCWLCDGPVDRNIPPNDPRSATVDKRATTAKLKAKKKNKTGREAMGRCPTEQDAEAAAEWLVDRMSRLSPDLKVSCPITPTGGQYLISLKVE